MNLLVIEDDVSIAQQVAGMLENLGHHVCAVVGNADEAIASALHNRPDLIIADIDLGPGGDGIEAAIRIRETTNARAIFLTASDDAATRNRAQHAWPLGFLAKPFDAPTFEAKLAGIVSMLESPFAQQFLHGQGD